MAYLRDDEVSERNEEFERKMAYKKSVLRDEPQLASSPLDRSLNDLGDVINNLDETLHRLRARLMPILNEDNSTAKDTVSDHREGSEVVTRVGECMVRLRFMQERVDSILDSLEV